MLRELNENEMMMVSGGTEDDPIDEVVSTGTRITTGGLYYSYSPQDSVDYTSPLGGDGYYGGSDGGTGTAPETGTTDAEKCDQATRDYNALLLINAAHYANPPNRNDPAALEAFGSDSGLFGGALFDARDQMDDHCG